MTIDAVTPPAYANVPNDPGVPPIARSPDVPTPNVAPVSGDGGTTVSELTVTASNAPTPKWGIFGQNTTVPVVRPDTIVGFEFKRDFTTPNYPIEDGGFADYNKVATPFDIRITMSKGGSIADRTSFIQILEDIVGNEDIGPDLTLYTVITPEFSWQNVNLVHWDMKRVADRGVTLITAEVWGREIRVSPPPAFANSKAVSGQSPQSGGTVQAQTPTTTQTTQATPATVPGPDGS